MAERRQRGAVRVATVETGQPFGGFHHAQSVTESLWAELAYYPGFIGFKAIWNIQIVSGRQGASLLSVWNTAGRLASKNVRKSSAAMRVILDASPCMRLLRIWMG